jgi:uncharacterized protein (DUF934 family)
MPKLIKLVGDSAAYAEDAFVTVLDEEQVPTQGDVIVSLQRFLAEGDALTAGRKVGVLVQPGDNIEDLAYDLPRLAVVALAFPKFRDGRAYSSARLLRDRYQFTGEIRAVGDVLQEQALHMVRCGFDAFEPNDGSDPQEWFRAAHRYRHVYQRAADRRTPVFEERAATTSTEQGG